MKLENLSEEGAVDDGFAGLLTLVEGCVSLVWFGFPSFNIF